MFFSFVHHCNSKYFSFINIFILRTTVLFKWIIGRWKNVLTFRFRNQSLKYVWKEELHQSLKHISTEIFKNWPITYIILHTWIFFVYFFPIWHLNLRPNVQQCSEKQYLRELCEKVNISCVSKRSCKKLKDQYFINTIFLWLLSWFDHAMPMIFAKKLETNFSENLIGHSSWDTWLFILKFCLILIN